MSYEGDKVFTIINSCGQEITDVRLMHFRDQDHDTELFVAEKMGTSQVPPPTKVFHSRKDVHDHWSVTFQILPPGKTKPEGYMSFDMYKNMEAKMDNLTFYISTTELVLAWYAGGERDQLSKKCDKLNAVIKS